MEFRTYLTEAQGTFCLPPGRVPWFYLTESQKDVRVLLGRALWSFRLYLTDSQRILGSS